MPQQAKLTQGSTLKHVSVMSFTGALGLMAMFLVDLVDMLFLSMLEQHEIVAAVGFASTVMFFTVSISIAVSVSATALVAKAVGSGDYALARRRATHVLLVGVIFSTLVVAFLWPRIPQVLSFFRAPIEQYLAQFWSCHLRYVASDHGIWLVDGRRWDNLWSSRRVCCIWLNKLCLSETVFAAT